MTITKSSALALCTSFWLATPTYAQTPPTVPTAPATAAMPVSPPTPASPVKPAGEPKAKEARAACLEEAKNRGLKGMDRRQSVMTCVVKQRPDLAGREQCRTDGFAKGLRKDELTSFVKDCAKAKS